MNINTAALAEGLGLGHALDLGSHMLQEGLLKPVPTHAFLRQMRRHGHS